MDDLSKLTDAELDALIESQQTQVDAIQAQVDHKTKMDADQEIRKDLIGTNLQAASLGFTQGATFNLIDEGVAAGLATKETLDMVNKELQKQSLAGFNNVLPTFKNNFIKYHRTINEGLEKAKKEHPEAFQASEIAGAITTGLLTGGTSLALKAGNSLVGQLSLLTAEGFMHGVGSSKAETLGGRLAGGVEGAETGAIFGAAGMAGGKVIKESLKKLGADSLVNFFSKDLKSFNKNIKGDHKEWSSRMAEYTLRDGSPVLRHMDTAEAAAERLPKALQETGEELGSILHTIDNSNLLSDKTTQSLINLLDRKVVSKISKGEYRRRSFVKLEDDLRKELQSELMTPHPSGKMIKLADGGEVPHMVPRKLSLADLNEYKAQLSSEIRSVVKSTDNDRGRGDQLVKLRDEIHHFIDREVSNVSKSLSEKGGEEGLYNTYKLTSLKYNDLVNTNKLLNAKIEQSRGSNVFLDAFKQNWAKMSIGGSVALAATGVGGLPVSGMVAGALAGAATTPLLNSMSRRGILKVSNAIKKRPDLYAKLSGELAIAADISGKAFNDKILEAGAIVDLLEDPVARTTDEIVARQDSILVLADKEDPEAASLIRKAIEKQDSDGLAIMITQLPGLSRYIQPGIGFDGKAVTKEEKAKVMSYISTLKPRDRRSATIKFQSDNLIPESMFTGQKPKEQLFNYAKKRNKVSNPEY